MASAPVQFDGVWKKFRTGERHDSLRDLIPAMVRGAARPTLARRAERSRSSGRSRTCRLPCRPGEALGIIGPNGAGKSTTLKLLTRILRPNRGRSVVSGRVGALIEVAAGFHPDLTGRENVYLQGAVMGMKRGGGRRAIRRDRRVRRRRRRSSTRQIKRYSSGMNARLGFSIAAHLESRGAHHRRGSERG